MGTGTENYLTVKELSKAAGVTPQSVYQQLSKKLKPFCKQSNGKTVISSRALREVYKVDACKEIDKELSNGNKELANLIDLLKSQLEAKDNQIKELMKQIDNLQEIITNQQKLTLLTDSQQKRHWWQFRKRRQEDEK